MTERLRQHTADGSPGVADAESHEQAGERSFLRCLDRLLQVRDGDLAETLERTDAIPVQRVDVRRIVDEVVLEKERHGALTESFDVHRAAAGEMTDTRP